MRHKYIVTCAFLLADLTFGQTANIVTNSGFEQGLMCYSTAIWDVANSAFPSDYQFLNSADAHSGSSSLEVRCVTPNCLKAAIISARIPTPPAQSYKLSVYSKCPAGRAAAIYIPGTQGGDLFQPLACTGNWAPNSFTFKVAADATDFFYYLQNRDLEWVRFDDVVLTYADGSVPQRPILHAGDRKTSISGGHLNVDGNPYLALGFFNVGYADLGQAASLGANTVLGYGGINPANCSNTAQESYLDKAYDFGLNFLPDSTSTTRLLNPNFASAVAAQYSHHLANIGWFLADEPDQINVPAFYIAPAPFVTQYQAMAAQSKLPLMVDYQRAAWSVPSDTVPYANTSDIWMAEPYGPDFSTLTHAVSTFTGLAPNRPIWLAQDDIDAPLIVPKAYWAVVNGATGIFYFYWDAFKAAPPKALAASQAFTELKQLVPVIFSPDLAITPPAGVGAIGRVYNGEQYVIAANPTAATVQGTFAVPGLAAGTSVEVLFENRTLRSSAGGFQDAFAGVSRHVYRIVSAPQSPLAVSRTIRRDAKTKELVVRVSVVNQAAVPAENAVLAVASINSVSGAPLPQTLGTIAPHATAAVSVRFPAATAKTWAVALVTVEGSSSLGAFGLAGRAILP